MEDRKIGYKDILRQKQYMKTVIADIINRFGDSIDSIAFIWLVYQVTGSAAWSAIIFGVNRIPTVFLQPFAGAAIEGRNKKKIMVITDIIRGICVGFIATALIIGFVNQWILLSATIVISCAEAFRGPASTSLIPRLLDKEYYAFGISLSRSTSSVTELIGLGVAGFIISVFSVSAAIYTDMATFFISALILSTLRVKEETMEKVKIRAKEYIDTLKEGFSYLRQNTMLRYFVILAVFLNAVLVPFNSLQAPLTKEILHSGGAMLSALSIGFSIGMIVGAALYPYFSRRFSNRTIVILGGYSIGMFYFAVLLVGRFITYKIIEYVIITIVSFFVGVAITLLSSLCSVEFIKNVKQEYLARCAAIFNAGGVAAIPIVSFIVSTVAGFTTTSILFMISGSSDIIICIFLCRKKKFYTIKKEGSEEVIYEEVGDSQSSESAG